MSSSTPLVPNPSGLDLSNFLIPCTAKCLYKQTKILTNQITKAYWQKFKKSHINFLEEKLLENLLLLERELINPEDPQFEDLAFPGHWIEYRFKDEKRDRGVFLDTVKVGPNSHKIISLDSDPIAMKLLTLQVGETFSIKTKGCDKCGVITNIFDYKLSKVLLQKNSFGLKN